MNVIFSRFPPRLNFCIPVLTLILFLFGAILLNGQKVTLGSEVLLTSRTELLQGKRIGIVSNSNTLLSNGTHLIDSLLALHYQVKMIFSPEHGFSTNASAGEKITNTKYRQTDIPVVSLYGERNRPSDEMFAELDVIIYDIQDVGARFYTYISTLYHLLESAALNHKPVIVLDRPNPLGGQAIDGPVLDTVYRSFVGIVPIPIQYGLTCGELANYMKAEKLFRQSDSLELDIVRMTGWRRDMDFSSTGLSWVKPSPNIPTPETALVYPGMCIFEASNISEGRGTGFPFLQVGAPFVSHQRLVSAIKKYSHLLTGLSIDTISFTPRSIPTAAAEPKHRDKLCHGIKIAITDKILLRPVRAGIALFAAFYESHKDSMTIRKSSLNRLSGVSSVYESLLNGSGADEIAAVWDDQLKQFDTIRKKYLLYK